MATNIINSYILLPDKRRKGGKRKSMERLAAIKNNELTFFTGLICKHGHKSNRKTDTGECIECKNTIHKANEKPKKRGYRFKHKYGLTEQQYEELLLKQNNVCAICHEKETITDGHTKQLKKLSVDHCHLTKKIRGLLCSGCNVGIGYFKNNSKNLRMAALYCEEA